MQVYDPLGSPWLSTLLAAAPIVVLLGLLVVGQSAPRAAVVGLGVALAGRGRGLWHAAARGAGGGGLRRVFGLLPIGWIVLAAVFLFHLTVRAGQFEVVKHSVAAISPDRRMQALLIAFSFGSFVEGAAGFGTPVAISAALLIGLGFSPLYAAGLGAVGQHVARRLRRAGHADHDCWRRFRASTKWRSARWPAGNCRCFR